MSIDMSTDLIRAYEEMLSAHPGYLLSERVSG
jgi:hypothetical protein